MSRPDEFQSEHEFVFDPTHGHNHDGENSRFISEALSNAIAAQSSTSITAAGMIIVTPTANGYSIGSLVDISFVQASDLAVAISPRWYPPVDLTLTTIFVSLNTAGSDSTVITVYKNGAGVATCTLTAGVHTNTATVATAYVADTDYLQIGVTTKGTGALDLNVQARFI